MPKKKEEIKMTFSDEANSASLPTTESIIDSPLSDNLDDETFVASGKAAPCEVGYKAHLPYWEKVHGNIEYGYDTYIVDLVAGCGDLWVCTVQIGEGLSSGALIPNIDIFFTEKNVEKVLNRLKRTEDEKKRAKWKKKINPEDIGIK